MTNVLHIVAPELPCIEVVPTLLNEQYDIMHQLFAFAIVVKNNGNAPIIVKEIGLMGLKGKKNPIYSTFPTVLEANARFQAVFYPDYDNENFYISAYVETADGKITTGKSKDLFCLNEG